MPNVYSSRSSLLQLAVYACRKLQGFDTVRRYRVGRTDFHYNVCWS